MAKIKRPTFRELRKFLEGFGFKYTRLEKCELFEHKKSNTIILMRFYRANEALGEADFKSVRGTLDYGGFIEHDEFEQALLAVKA
jgi:hypothetical protein